MAENIDGPEMLEECDDFSRILDVHPNVLSEMLDDLQGEPTARVEATSVVTVYTGSGVRQRTVNSRFQKVSDDDIEKIVWEQRKQEHDDYHKKLVECLFWLLQG